MTVSIQIEDVEGLEEVLAKLAENFGIKIYEGYGETRFEEPRLGGELAKDLERIRARLTVAERKLEIREQQDTCLVCNRVIEIKHKSQPLLCERHFDESPLCPDCGAAGPYTGIQWTPKHAKATCLSCKKVFSGKEMQFRIAARWASEYDE